jgi:hypothetical protein
MGKSSEPVRPTKTRKQEIVYTDGVAEAIQAAWEHCWEWEAMMQLDSGLILIVFWGWSDQVDKVRAEL